MVEKISRLDKEMNNDFTQLNNLLSDAVVNSDKYNLRELANKLNIDNLSTVNVTDALKILFNIVDRYNTLIEFVNEYKNVIYVAENMKYRNKGECSYQFKGLTDKLLCELAKKTNINVSKMRRILKSKYNLDYSWSGINKRLKQLNIK